MMRQKTFFPLFVDMGGKRVLVVGGGNVAERRVKILTAFGADVTVVSPLVTEYIERVASSNISTDINIDTDTYVNTDTATDADVNTDINTYTDANTDIRTNLNTLRLIKREYRHGDIAAVNPFLIIAATNDRQVNHNIMTEAKRLNILVSVADSREECTFYFPAIAENEDYIAGLVSKNGDHAGVKQTVQHIRAAINR